MNTASTSDSANGRMTVAIDDFDLASFLPVAARFGTDRYGYVVTPNVDHLIRWFDSPAFREYYADADYVLLDSRVASRLLRFTKALQLRVCTGSDLTAGLFADVAAPSDRILLVGGTEAQAQELVARFGLTDFHHHQPPMGFIRDPAAVADCLRFIESASPFRFCFLAVGSPQQEVVAHALKERGRARGLALCIGASIDFMTGREVRAPDWMQRASLEWLFRLVQNPLRLARRYLVRGPRVISIVRRSDVLVRAASDLTPSARQTHSPWPTR